VGIDKNELIRHIIELILMFIHSMGKFLRSITTFAAGYNKDSAKKAFLGPFISAEYRAITSKLNGIPKGAHFLENVNFKFRSAEKMKASNALNRFATLTAFFAPFTLAYTTTQSSNLLGALLLGSAVILHQGYVYSKENKAVRSALGELTRETNEKAYQLRLQLEDSELIRLEVDKMLRVEQYRIKNRITFQKNIAKFFAKKSGNN